MLQLLSLEVCNSVFNTNKQNNKLELPKAIEEIEKRYSLEDLKIDGKRFRPEDLKMRHLKGILFINHLKLSLMT